MKILRFDSIGGASGDMILATLTDLGADLDAIRKHLSRLSLEPFEIRTETVSNHGFAGTRLRVDVDPHAASPHRHLSDIQALIRGAALPPGAEALSLKTFERLAHAEAAVHGTTPDHVHFHEVGAVDSIVDIVGACLALESLGIDGVQVSPLPLGCGETTFSHGVMPVPVPATVELLKGMPVRQTDEPFELVTPTGAALLTTWAAELPAGNAPAATIEATGTGFGHRHLNTRLNLLRAQILSTGAAAAATDECLVLECNLDDTVPELLGSLATTLLTKGALDVFTVGVQMKKQRPGTLLTVLCRPEERDDLLDAIFTESTTFGVREYVTHRTMLERRVEPVQTPYGEVRAKIGTWKGRDITTAPEHDDCVRCAAAAGVPVRTVYEAALRAVTP